MAVRTVAQSGLYSATSTWVGGVKPVAGDTVVNTGFDVTQDENADLGTGTGDCITNTSGTWTINDNITLDIRGDISNAASPFTVGAGVTIRNPDNAEYQIKIGTTTNLAQNWFYINGTAGNRTIIQATGGASSAIRFPTVDLTSLQCDLQFADFRGVKGEVNGGIDFAFVPRMSTSGSFFRLRNCDFDGCGAVGCISNIATNGTFSLDSTTFRNTVDPNWCMRIVAGNTLVSGERKLTNMVFDKPIDLQQFANFQCDNWVLKGRWRILNGHNYRSKLNNICVYLSSTLDANIPNQVDMENIYWVTDDPQPNPHGFNSIADGGTFSCKSVYFDFQANGVGEGQTGDMFLHSNSVSSGTQNITYERCICGSSPNGTRPGRFASFGNLENRNVTIRRNSMNSTLLVIGEANLPVTGSLIDVSGNITAFTNPNTDFKALDLNGTVADALAPAVVRDNAGHNMQAGSNGFGYNNFNNPGGTLGQNDKDGDPEWKNTPLSRTIKQWDESLGGNGVLSDTLDRMMKMNDSDFDTRYTVANLLLFFQQGWIPTNEAFRGAANGEDIGAVDMGTPPPEEAGAGANLVDRLGHFGDLERGQSVTLRFRTRAGNLLTDSFTNVGSTGNPVLGLRQASTGNTLLNGAGNDDAFSAVTFNEQPGQHAATINTSSVFTTGGDDYELYISDGQVIESGEPKVVSNESPWVFSVENRTAGFVLTRAVKVINGVIDTVTSAREFVITGNNLNTSTPNYYRSQVLTFQPGSQNQAIGKVILNSTVVSTSPPKVSITVQDVYPTAPAAGDPFVILPEERELTAYTANIVFEAGIGQGAGDKFTIEWMENGQKILNPASIITNMKFETFRWSDDVQLDNIANLVASANSGTYKHTGTPANAIQPSDGVTMHATATIDGNQILFPRTMFNNA